MREAFAEHAATGRDAGVEAGAAGAVGLGDHGGRIAYLDGRGRPEYHVIHGGVERDRERQRQGDAGAGPSRRSAEEQVDDCPTCRRGDPMDEDTKRRAVDGRRAAPAADAHIVGARRAAGRRHGQRDARLLAVAAGYGRVGGRAREGGRHSRRTHAHRAEAAPRDVADQRQPRAKLQDRAVHVEHGPVGRAVFGCVDLEPEDAVGEEGGEEARLRPPTPTGRGGAQARRRRRVDATHA